MTEVRRVRARLDAKRVAVLGELVPLRYADGGAASEDRPGHVRGASALCRDGDRLVIVQDDVHVLALRDGAGIVSARLLPADERGGDVRAGGVRTFDDRRGNKHRKLDLEACIRLPDGRIVALGSGSGSSAAMQSMRERLVVMEPEGAVRIVEGHALYAGLRAERAFAGSELNVEGAVVVGGVIRLFQRGNGAARDGLAPVSATADLSLARFLDWLDRGAPAPRPERVVQVDLGEVDGVRYGFTDAAALDDGRIAFLACAEDSPDAVRDGRVHGCRFGVIEGSDCVLAPVVDRAGRPVALKLEGIAARPGAAGEFDVVVDMDRIDEPARLGRLVVSERRGGGRA